MNSYKISFYRRKLNTDGNPDLLALDQVEIRSAPSAIEALVSAIEVFETRRRLSNWRDLADCYRIVSASDSACWGVSANSLPPEIAWFREAESFSP